MKSISTKRYNQTKQHSNNQDAARSFFGPSTIQPKLEIGKPDDEYEKEADQVADAVMRMPDPKGESIQRKCKECEEEEKNVQRKEVCSEVSGNSLSHVDEVVHSSKGKSLDAQTRAFMEPRFGYDFSGVRIYDDAKANESSDKINALAYTHGDNIVFNKNQYSPETSRGKRLLAHELTHVVQQGNTSKKSNRLGQKTSTARKNQIQRQEHINFPDEQIVVPVENISGRGSDAGEREVEAEIIKLRGWVNLYLGAYRDGLNSFSDTMSFASDEEARPRYFDVALKEVGKVLLDELINYATTDMPIIGPVVKGAKSVITALYQEAQRANTAQGEARIRSYIVSTRNAISENGGIQRQLLEIMDNARPVLLNKYRDAVAHSAAGASDDTSRQEFIQSQGVHGHLVGEAATFLRDLKSQIEHFKRRVPDATTFQRRFTEAFADTPGLTDYISHGGQESGSLHLHMEIYRQQEGSGSETTWSYRIDDTDSSWQLATSAPQASRLAQSLNDTIRGNVANTSLPKYLHVRVETEVFGLNDYDNAVIYFRNPRNPDFRGWDVNLSRWVWGLPRVRQRALSVSRISGG